MIERRLFTTEEIDLLRLSAKEDKVLEHNAFGKADGEGGTIRLSLWNYPGDGIYGHVARFHRIVDNNSKQNNPTKIHHHPSYTPLIKVSDDSLKAVGMKRFAQDDAVAWLNPGQERNYHNT